MEDAPQTTTLETEAETVEINNESSTENNAETSGTSVDDVNLEAETIRKGLIEELIAEAETAEPDAEASEQPENAEEVPPTELPVVDGSEALKDEMSNAETTLEQPAATNNEEKSEATTTTEVTTDETGEKPNTSDEASIDDKTGTQEKLKSLMSEWVDDDDDDNDNEDENGVSAAAKEQL